MAVVRVVAGVPAVLSWQQVGSDGEPVDPGVVSCAVSRFDGSPVASGAASGSGVGPRTFGLSAGQVREVDRLTVEWSVGGDVFAADVVEVAGGLWFSNREIRAARSELSDVQRFPVAVLDAARQVVEGKFESWTCQAWVPRLAVEVVDAAGWPELPVVWPTVRRVRSVEFLSSGQVVSSLSPGECAAIPASRSGLLVRSAGWARGDSVRVAYEHGADAPTPELAALAMRVCADSLAKAKGGGLPENAISYAATELGMTIQLATPGVRGAVSTIPDVNECVPRHTWHRPGIG